MADSAMRQRARLWTHGSWGIVNPPAFAYDLTKGALIQSAKVEGLVRYGRAPGSSDDDTRPLGLVYDLVWLITPTGTEISPVINNSTLKPLPNVFGGVDSLGQNDHKENQPCSFRSSFNVPRNGAWTLWAYLFTPPKKQALKLHQWFWGAPGAGFVFQIRAGTAEIAGLSSNYNDADMATLRVLWAIKDPTPDETSQLETLKKKLFVDFESLSFEKSIGKGDWYGNEFKLSFIPEPRGVLHIVAEGLDATAHEVKTILKTRKAGVLWEETPLTLWNGGGAFFFTLGFPRFRASAKMDFGPLRNGYWADSLGDLTYAYNRYVTDSQTITMKQIGYDANGQPTSTEAAPNANGDEEPETPTYFGFEVKIENGDTRSTPWLYGLSARLAPGSREGMSDNQPFDTDVPYVPANSASPRYDGPKILDISPSWDGALNRRTAQVRMIDMLGTLAAGKASPANRVATLQIGDEPFITNGLVTSVKRADMASLDRTPIPRNARPETEMIVTLADGWQILGETECEPPPIGDGQRLGAHIRQFLAIAGFSSGEMSGVYADAGKRLPAAALGEDWTQRVDSTTMVADAIRGLLDAYGLGWQFYQDNLGVWHLVRPFKTPVAQFSSSRVPLPHAEPGRLAIFRGIDIAHDASDYFNHFVVTGGEKGELVKEWTNWPSIKAPLHPAFIGRRKTKRLHNSGFRTMDDLDYALRSLQYRYARGGQRGEYTSYFHRRFWAGQRIEGDGSVWEIEGLSGGSWAKDESRFSVFEVLL